MTPDDNNTALAAILHLEGTGQRCDRYQRVNRVLARFLNSRLLRCTISPRVDGTSLPDNLLKQAQSAPVVTPHPTYEGTPMPVLQNQNDIFVLDLGDGENRLHPDWIAAVNSALDEVEKHEGPGALVTVANGKFYSNGLDLDWLSAHRDQHNDYIAAVQALYARFLALPVMTVAAIQGHAFAAGAMLSLAHDFRVMRADRGFWCLPEMDINLPFPRGMAALVQSRLSPQIAHEAMLTARRYGGTDAQAAGIVDHAVEEASISETALTIAHANLTKAGETLGITKSRMYAPVLATLRDSSNPRG